jgi:hypothetical protein
MRRYTRDTDQTEMPGSQESSRRSEALAAMLSDIAPLLRSRIRARRGARIAHIGTSDIYASVVRRTIELEQKQGLTALDSAAESAPDSVHRADAQPAQRRGLRKLLHLLIDRVIIDAKRREKSEEKALREVAPQARAAEGEQPQEAALSAEERARVAVLVDSLGESDRELLFLRLSGREWAEVAAQTGSTEAASRQRFHRLTTEIARILEAESR